MKCYLNEKELREFGDYGPPHPDAPKTTSPAVATTMAIVCGILSVPLFILFLWALWTVMIPVLIVVGIWIGAAFFKY